MPRWKPRPGMKLTPNEKICIALTSCGFTGQQIADLLKRSIWYIRNLRDNVRIKYDVITIQQAAAKYALERKESLT